jgi:negative regulator of sigma-B (phosphoserine phosphatase)
VIDSGSRKAFEWAIAEASAPGEAVSGDRAVVVRDRHAYLIAAIDGLGHGEGAAEAASVAANTVTANSAEPLDNLLVLCHQAMVATRGAAVTLGRVDATNASLSWVGVGNVEAFLVRHTPTGAAPVHSPVLSGGIVGFNLPRVSVRTVDLRAGDLIVFATDGVDPKYADDIRLGTDVKSLAEHILRHWSKSNDDALVLATRFRGEYG